MRIDPGLSGTNAADAGEIANARNPQGSVSQKNSPRTTAEIKASTDLPETSTHKENAAAAEALNLSFRKDTDGKTYYVLTDPRSGQIVREIPPEQIRQVGQGIEQFLKSQAALATEKTDIKA